MAHENEGLRPVSLWIGTSLLRQADRIAHEREVSRATYLRSLIADDVARRESQQAAASAA